MLLSETITSLLVLVGRAAVTSIRRRTLQRKETEETDPAPPQQQVPRFWWMSGAPITIPLDGRVVYSLGVQPTFLFQLTLGPYSLLRPPGVFSLVCCYHHTSIPPTHMAAYDCRRIGLARLRACYKG